MAHITLYGDESVICPLIPSSHTRMAISHAAQFVAPSEKPGAALRHKKASSMWCALEALAKGDADAVLSAGNTGALMAMALHLVGALAGIGRPAICKRMPTEGRSCYVLDLGANAAADAEQLEQFALMGAALAAVEGIEPVRVGLLNIGAENQKGTETLRLADDRLQHNKRFQYVGYVEGDALFVGSAHVVVCDGFTGNVALKASEGLARYLMADMRRFFMGNVWRKVLGGCVQILGKAWLKRLNPAAYNGALLVGLKGVVVKSHGGADATGFYAALVVAYEQAQRKPHQLLAQWLAAKPV